MKTLPGSPARHLLQLCFFTFALGIFTIPAARAGLSLEMNVIRYHQFGYYFAPNFGTNTAAPIVPFGDYYLTSSGYPTNGASAFYHYDTNGFNQIGGGPFGYGDFNSMIHELTNGTWSIYVTNSVTTNVYSFTVTANISSNDLPYVNITFPADGSVNVTNQPTFTWQGPTNYSDLVAYGFNSSPFLPVTQTSLLSPNVLYQGINSFTPHYDRYSTTDVVSSVPLDNGLNPIFSWGSTAHLQDYATSQFTVGTVDPSGTSHTLVAHYAWDGTNADGTASGADTSGNGYNMNFGGNFGGAGGVNSTTDPAAGPRAIQFHNGNGNSAGYVGWNPTPAPLLTALAGSFSVSCWIKTTQNFNFNGDPAYYGAGIVSADNAGLANDVIPIALTGSQIAFNTGGATDDVTLNSVASVNDGNYHHIVVTRNQRTGQKIIYIDGVLDSFSSGTTNLLSDAGLLSIGALSDARDPDAPSTYYYNGYDGELDDLQIYSGVLSSNEVAQLFANPGSTTANNGGFSGGHTNVAYYSFEDDSLFAHDFSGNGNDIDSYSDYTMSPYITNDAVAGLHAFAEPGDGWLNPPTNLLSTLAGSFSVSLWLKTSETNGNDDDDVYSAAGIVSAFNGGGNDIMPMGLNGSKLAFYTGGSSQNTLHSQTNVNTGQYVHVVVTRNQQTGEKKIYVNGVLDASGVGSTDSLVGTGGLTIGFNNGRPFTGEMDEIQFYSGVLSASEVLQLHNHPGTVIPDLAASAANGLVAHYDFDEGTVVAPDVSGNGNNLVLAGNFGGAGPATNSDAIAGASSVSFDGGSFLSAPANLLSTLAGSFSISLWVNTSQNNGDPDDFAWTGDAIISADIPNSGANDLIPMALTGGQIAFNTANTEFNYDDTINSSATVNDGNWHHVVVSRNQPTGEKSIYIDGVLDTSDVDATNLLNDPKLLTIGCKANASNPDPASPSSTGQNGYNGLLDDVQIYDRVLSPAEVSFLYNNPGVTLANSASTPYPVDVNLQLTFIRSQDPNLGEIFGASVSFNSVNPAPTTTNSVHSPNNYFNSEQYPSGGDGSGAILNSLGDVLNECTNGLWKIYINQGSPTQEVYSFQVFISGLDTNLLKAVKVFSPTNGAVNVATNPVFYWNGPSNFSTLQIELLNGPVAYPPVTATNWSSPPTLNYGPHRFDVDYNSNNFPGITFTMPMDASANAIHSWTTTGNLASESFNTFVVGAPAPLPVLITNLTRTGGNLQFSFRTLAGRPHIIQARTNLTVGAWLDLTNFVGDGSLKQFTFPAASPPIRFFRVNTQ